MDNSRIQPLDPNAQDIPPGIMEREARRHRQLQGTDADQPVPERPAGVCIMATARRAAGVREATSRLRSMLATAMELDERINHAANAIAGPLPEQLPERETRETTKADGAKFRDNETASIEAEKAGMVGESVDLAIEGLHGWLTQLDMRLTSMAKSVGRL